MSEFFSHLSYFKNFFPGTPTMHKNLTSLRVTYLFWQFQILPTIFLNFFENYLAILINIKFSVEFSIFNVLGEIIHLRWPCTYESTFFFVHNNCGPFISKNRYLQMHHILIEHSLVPKMAHGWCSLRRFNENRMLRNLSAVLELSLGASQNVSFMEKVLFSGWSINQRWVKVQLSILTHSRTAG